MSQEELNQLLSQRWEIEQHEGGYSHSLDEILGESRYMVSHCGHYAHVVNHRHVCSVCGASLPRSSVNAYYNNPAQADWQRRVNDVREDVLWENRENVNNQREIIPCPLCGQEIYADSPNACDCRD